ncbi:MAG: c-type cytochrome [Gemmatimonadota bacterium]
MERRALLVALALMAACADPETYDARGYTKAPLETPGLIVEGEPATSMEALGDPDLLRSEDPAGMAARDPEAGAGRAAGEAGGEAGEETPLAAGVTREEFDRGEELFAGQGACEACHGPGGTGSQLGPDLTDAEWLNLSSDPSVEAIAEVIRTGVADPRQYPAPMPPMGGANLTDDQVRAIAAYVASLGQG